MKVLLIGFGSIGKRHYEVLKSFDNVESIEIVTRQALDGLVTYKNLENVKNLAQYDYFLIASATDKHYEQLKFLENHVKNKLIFCEKPLFDHHKELEIKNNSVYIGYVLRFHPLLKKLYALIEEETVLNINIICGQYLPAWRSNIDYRKSYSAHKEQGGGVLLDLSHEIDYMQWLCGPVEEVKSYQLKVSDLEINSDDLTTFIGKTNRGVVVNLSIDYISKITYRKLLLHTLQSTYELDFINNKLIQKDKCDNKIFFNVESLERNRMFKDMHESVISNKENLCNYDEAREVMNTIYKIQEQNR